MVAEIDVGCEITRAQQRLVDLPPGGLPIHGIVVGGDRHREITPGHFTRDKSPNMLPFGKVWEDSNARRNFPSSTFC